MAKKINVSADGFAAAVHDALEEYFEDIVDGSLEAVEEVAIETARDLKKDSPENSGEYKKGWYVKPISKSKTHALVEIGNKHYQLTHLLEHGHIKVVHGTVLGFTAANPHIAKNERKAIKSLEKRIERKVQNDFI